MSEVERQGGEQTRGEKLIRCRMVNSQGQPSIRFVALEYFLLWRYMMEHRHGFSFEEYALCLWVDEVEYQQKPDLYAHSGELEQVIRIEIAIYDEANRYTYKAVRYVLESECDSFTEIVSQHVPGELRQSGRFEIENRPGYAVVRERAAEHERFVLGLYSGLHDLY